jgi:hypothetical protein
MKMLRVEQNVRTFSSLAEYFKMANTELFGAILQVMLHVTAYNIPGLLSDKQYRKSYGSHT